MEDAGATVDPGGHADDTQGSGRDAARDEATNRIRRAALDLFTEVGFGSATVDQIAERAGVGIASLYRRWPDKAALANNLYSDFVVEMQQAVQPEGLAAESELSAEEQFQAVWLRLWEFAVSDPQRLMFIETQTYSSFMSPESLNLKAALMDSTFELFGALGLEIEPNVGASMVMGTIVTVLRLEATADPETLGRRIWAALSATP